MKCGSDWRTGYAGTVILDDKVQAVGDHSGLRLLVLVARMEGTHVCLRLV